MKNIITNKRGQFVIIAALIIAVLTLSTIISVYEITINSQTIVYKPVDEFLLGTTSDMNRALTSALSSYTMDVKNGNLQSNAGQQTMDKWQRSLFTSYPNYGIRLNQPISSYFDYKWQVTTGYSEALVTYDLDVASYGFIGWAGETVKYVQLQILTIDPSGTISFKLTESLINKIDTAPVADLPTSPSPDTFNVVARTLGPNFGPVNTSPNLTYEGNGVYKAAFTQTIDPTQGITLSLQTPVDKIWVSATLPAGELPPGMDSKTNPILLTIPPANAVAGTSFHDTAVLSAATKGAIGTVTYSLWSGTYPTGTQIGSSSQVDVESIVPNSASFTINNVGSYYFMATYSGDEYNNPASGNPEPFTVNPTSPSSGLNLLTVPPNNAVVEFSFVDQAALNGATSNAGGSVTYTLYSGTPGNGIQVGSPSQVTVTNGVIPNSAPFTVHIEGSYYFMASYSGDSNNNAVSGDPETFSVGLIVPFNDKSTPALLTTPPGSQVGVPSVSLNTIVPVYSQTSYSLTLKDPTNQANGALGISTNGYWVGQIPVQLKNGTSTYQTMAFCMDFDKEANVGSTNSATLTKTTDDATWRAASYILSWISPASDNDAAVEQVALWKILDAANYHRPSWLSTSIDNQATALVTLASGKDVVRQGDTLKWISPLNGNLSSISLIPGSTMTFQAQVTRSNGAPRSNVQLQFTANLESGGVSLPLNSTYVSKASEYTDSNGIVQVNIKVPSDTPQSAVINVQASTQSVWPQMYIDLNNVQYQDFLVTGPILDQALSANVKDSINVAPAALIGTPFFDMATLTGTTSNAGGTVIYTLYSGTYPSGNQIGTSQATVTNGLIPNSASFTVNTGGPHYFLATYSGDSNNNAAIGAVEPFVVDNNLVLSTTPPSAASAGSAFFDRATLIGATSTAGGTVTYKLYSGTYPSGTQVGTSSTVSVSNGVVPNSVPFTVTSVGPYYFIAQYSGDGINNPVNGAAEPFTVSMPQYSGVPFYFSSSNTQNPWLDDLPPTSSDKINSYISNGQTTSTVKADTTLSSNMVISNKVNATLYIGTSQAISQLNIDVGFYYQNRYYDIGNANLYNIPKSTSNKPYSATITVNVNTMVFVQGYAPLTVPQGSIMSITSSAPNYNGRITLYYGPGQMSHVAF